MIDISGLSTPQLKAIRQIIVSGVSATSEISETKSGKSEEVSTEKEVKMEKDLEVLGRENESLKAEVSTLKEKAGKVDELTGLVTEKDVELEALRTYKKGIEEAAARAERIKAVKDQLGAAGLETDVDAEAEYWLSMSTEVLTKTISKLVEIKKGATASASFKVPALSDKETSKDDVIKTVRDGLKERKSGK